MIRDIAVANDRAASVMLIVSRLAKECRQFPHVSQFD